MHSPSLDLSDGLRGFGKNSEVGVVKLRFVIFLYSLSLAGFGTLFLLEDRGYFSRIRDPIGTVVESEGVVRHLQADQFSWNRAEAGYPVGRNDTVSVGENSWAKISLNDGSQLELEEGTTLVLKQEPNRLALSFLSGKAQVFLAENPEQKTEIMNTDLKNITIQKEKPQVRKVATVRRVSRVAEVSAKKVLQVLNTGGRTISLGKLLSAPSPIFPSDGSVFKVKGPQRLDLKWEPMSASKKANEFENPKAFEVVLRQQSPEAAPAIFSSTNPNYKTGPLKPGKYFWSVKSLSGSGRAPAESRVYSFELISEATKPAKPKVEVMDSNFFVKPTKKGKVLKGN